MTVASLIEAFDQTGTFSPAAMEAIQDYAHPLRAALIAHFRTQKHLAFARALLRKLINIRLGMDEDAKHKDVIELKEGDELPEGIEMMEFADEISVEAENLMMGCYIVAMHQQVEDSLLIWQAKYADFDTYCMLDTELVVFSGVEETIAYLETVPGEEAAKAVEFIKDRYQPGNYPDMDFYFANAWYL